MPQNDPIADSLGLPPNPTVIKASRTEKVTRKIEDMEITEIGQRKTEPVAVKEKTEKTNLPATLPPPGTTALAQADTGDTPLSPSEQKAEDDIEMARVTLHEVIRVGTDVMDSAAQVAQSSEHPRAFEAFALIMARVSEASRDLAGLHKTAKEIRRREPPPQQASDPTDLGAGTIINADKAVFVGSPKDLVRYLAEAESQKAQVIDVESVEVTKPAA